MAQKDNYTLQNKHFKLLEKGISLCEHMWRYSVAKGEELKTKQIQKKFATGRGEENVEIPYFWRKDKKSSPT